MHGEYGPGFSPHNITRVQASTYGNTKWCTVQIRSISCSLTRLPWYISYQIDCDCNLRCIKQLAGLHNLMGTVAQPLLTTLHFGSGARSPARSTLSGQFPSRWAAKRGRSFLLSTCIALRAHTDSHLTLAVQNRWLGSLNARPQKYPCVQGIRGVMTPCSLIRGKITTKQTVAVQAKGSHPARFFTINGNCSHWITALLQRRDDRQRYFTVQL